VPDVKIRDLDPEVFRRLQERAYGNRRSMEAELRMIVAESVASHVTADDWEGSGFEEVDEIVPGRLYEAWADSVCYRIAVTRPIVTGSSVAWNSSIDMLHVSNPFGTEEEQRRIWVRPVGIPSRLLGDTPDMALRDAMRWLGNWAGFDAEGHARRDAVAAEEMDVKLRGVVDEIDQHLGSDVIEERWRDRDRARWSAADRDFFVSRVDADKFILFTYERGTSRIVGTPERFELSRKGARIVARRIRDGLTHG
jgi:hypothetical protein